MEFPKKELHFFIPINGRGIHPINHHTSRRCQIIKPRKIPTKRTDKAATLSIIVVYMFTQKQKKLNC